jgi:hypothetical protein
VGRCGSASATGDRRSKSKSEVEIQLDLEGAFVCFERPEAGDRRSKEVYGGVVLSPSHRAVSSVHPPHKCPPAGPPLVSFREQGTRPLRLS